MKRFYVMSVLCAMVLLFSIENVIGKAWYKKAWSEVKSGASSVVSTIKDTSKACARASSLGTEWAAKKSAFYGLQALISTQELAIKSARKSFDAAQRAYNAAEDVLAQTQREINEAMEQDSGGFKKALHKVSDNFDKLFDINGIGMIAKLSDLPKIRTPEFNVHGILAGKPWSLHMQLTGEAVKDAAHKLFKQLF